MDYEKLWHIFKEYIKEKPSHGKNQLQEKMRDLEIKEAKGEL